MSTYNGEKYLEEQLESVFNQTYKNIDIFVRDDGSTDSTLQILNKYKDKLKIIEGGNEGVINSFKSLMLLVNDYDYYAFCDQDDIWIDKKIEYAVNYLEKEYNEVPLLYSANIDYYDAHMNFISHESNKKNVSFANSLIDYISPGMTMVFNNKAKEYMVKTYTKDSGLHDGWLYRICSALGKVIFDDRVVVKYRRYDGTATITKQSILSKILWNFEMFLLGKHWKNIRKQLIYFKDCFYNDLKEEDKQLIDLFTSKKSLKTQIKKFFYKEKYKEVNDIKMRIMFLLWNI